MNVDDDGHVRVGFLDDVDDLMLVGRGEGVVIIGRKVSCPRVEYLHACSGGHVNDDENDDDGQ